MLRQCCECKRIWVNGKWVFPRLSQLAGADISHGYCNRCFEKTMRRIHQRRPQTAPQGFIYRLLHLLL